MSDRKLRPKYMVCKINEAGEMEPPSMVSVDPDDVGSPFVLMPRKDPAAFYALLSYAQVCEADLAREIRIWLGEIASAPPVFGSQGLRNRVYMKMKQMDLME